MAGDGVDGDPYEVLELNDGATEVEIRAAYRRLARRYHPDRHGDESDEVRAEAQRRMAELNAALRILTSPVERAQHERVMRARRRAREVQDEPTRTSPPAHRSSPSAGQDRRTASQRASGSPSRQSGNDEPGDPDFDYRKAAASEFAFSTRSDARVEFTARTGREPVVARLRKWLRRS